MRVVKAVRHGSGWLPVPMAVAAAMAGWVVIGATGGPSSSGGPVAAETYGSGGVLLTLGQIERLAGHDMSGDGESSEVLDGVEVIEGTEATVRALDGTFDAENIQVVAATKVMWSNHSQMARDVVPLQDKADWRVRPDALGPGDAYERTVGEPGTYRYCCSLHPGMTGAVVVEDQGSFTMPQSMTPGMQAEDEDRIHVEVIVRKPHQHSGPIDRDRIPLLAE